MIQLFLHGEYVYVISKFWHSPFQSFKKVTNRLSQQFQHTFTQSPHTLTHRHRQAESSIPLQLFSKLGPLKGTKKQHIN